MGRNRSELHDILCEILGSRNCYFSPPSSIQLKYPCIIYSLSNILQVHADNRSYQNTKRYTVTVVDSNPDSDIPEKLLDIQYCSWDRNYTTDGLYHYVFTIFF